MDLKLRSEDQDYKVAFAIEQYGNYPLYFKKNTNINKSFGNQKTKNKSDFESGPQYPYEKFPFPHLRLSLQLNLPQ